MGLAVGGSVVGAGSSGLPSPSSCLSCNLSHLLLRIFSLTSASRRQVCFSKARNLSWHFVGIYFGLKIMRIRRHSFFGRILTSNVQKIDLGVEFILFWEALCSIIMTPERYGSSERISEIITKLSQKYHFYLVIT